MRFSRPRSLASQLILLLVIAVVAAQVPASVIFAFQTTKVGRVAFTARIGDRVAALVHVLKTVPPPLRSNIAAAYSLAYSRFSLDDQATVEANTMGTDETRLSQAIAGRLRDDVVQVRVQLVDDARSVARYLPWFATSKTLLVSTQLAGGRWLNAQSRVNAPDAPLWLQIGLLQLGAAIAAILLTLGLGLGYIIRPVTALARAASKVGHGVAVAPLPERGSRELRSMTASFNAMQARLRAFVDDRTRMLGAISHDLRTPLASLWLRAEMVEDAEQRDAMVRTLAEMKHMVEATLAFARDDAIQENGPVDLAQVARHLVDDHRALGRDVSMEGPPALPFHGRSLPLRRALDNLVENAVRYGARARLSLANESGRVRIRVDDDGPGLPPDRIEEMFQPFVRLDPSRNAQTGGTGLGLAIARTAVREHGGELTLVNQPEGGLRAEVVLPKAAATQLDAATAD